ncbi:MAG: DUF6265 family protein [Gemmatimonadetes bacterium]|nr:DUF6265 family protein [Gemmatimonadota bacterium]
MRPICRTVICAAAVLAAVSAALSSEVEAPRLDRLAWLAGSWTGGEGDAVMEEHWTTPAGGLMVGMHRDLRPGRRAFFEFLRIVEEKGQISYHAMPAGRSPATIFPLLSMSDRRVVFENPDHDFPQRILYWLDDEGMLHARIEGTEDGETRGMEWHYRR